MSFKKTLCVLLVILSIFALASCSGKDDETERSDYTLQTGDEYWLGDNPKEDMDGYEFRILSRPDMVKLQYVEEQTGDIINDAVFKRNETVKSYFNIDIVSIESGTSSGDDALNSILAGDDQYDVIFPHTRSAFQYAIQDTLVNYNDVSTIHLDKEWWSQDIVDSCEVNGYLYVLDGDISTQRLSSAFCMFFNKRIFTIPTRWLRTAHGRLKSFQSL